MSIPEPNSGCWLWLSSTNGVYGTISVVSKTMYAHRASFQAFVRPPAPNEFVCHRCDTPLCVNPEHLFIGPRQVNIDDSVSKDRHTRGMRHAMAKLTDVDVLTIRERFSKGESAETLAWTYGLHPSTISRAASGERWKHLGGPTRRNRRADVILDWAKANEIRSLRYSSEPRKQMAARFGVTLPTLYAIWLGRQWKVEGDPAMAQGATAKLPPC
jgi:hypothetical protein